MIIMILGFRVDTYKDKKISIIDQRMKATISHYSLIQRCQVREFFAFYLFYCSLKEKEDIKRKANNKKNYM